MSRTDAPPRRPGERPSSRSHRRKDSTMTTTTHTATDASRRIAHADDRATRVLVTAGAIAGPVFVLTAGVQTVSRDGFDLTRQPISMLSLGDAGWVQITNFILAGVVMLGFAVGAGRALRGGPSRRW